MPHVSDSVEACFRAGYGILLFVILTMAFRHGQRFFLSEKWGGYGESSRHVEVVQNPIVYPVVAVLWLLCAILITCGVASIWASLINLLLCRYFFVQMRWKGVLRGMGAPGFMTYWLGMVTFLLEYALHYASDLYPLVLLVAQVDFALIMLSSGIYKFFAGYPRNHGMELGMVNPQWGYWWKHLSKLSPNHWFFQFCNQMAWSVQIAAAVLMLVPQTRLIGALMIMGSFVFIATQIRLGVLCHMVILGGLLFFTPGSFFDQAISQAVPQSLIHAPVETVGPRFLNFALGVSLCGYLGLLPLAHGGLFYNFYGRKTLPDLLQKLLEIYTNFFGLIIWRVFSVDVTNFYVLIYEQPSDGASRRLLSHYDRFGSRHNHVGEAITVTCVFTTLKYYPSDSARFQSRLLRYAKTLPCPDDSILVFEYRSIRKKHDQFETVTVAEYHVDVYALTVEEKTFGDDSVVRSPHSASPIFEGVRPGSYVALGE